MSRIRDLGAVVYEIPTRAQLPDIIARCARAWAEIHEHDQALALELAAKLPSMKIVRAYRADGEAN